MKICLTSSGPSEDSNLDIRFGRCPFFIVYNDKQDKYAVVKNEYAQTARGAGIAAAQKISDLGCQVLITGNIGPNAFQALQTAGIKIFCSSSGKISEILEEYKKGDLKELGSPQGRCGFGFGRGRGGGFGRDRGRGGAGMGRGRRGSN